METETETSSTTIEHVTKASSAELLRKFAELDADPPSRSSRQSARLPIVRLKRSRRVIFGLAARDLATCGAETPSTRRRRRSGGLAEWKALLPPTASSRRSASLLRRMGFGWLEMGPGDDATGIKFLLAALEKDGELQPMIAIRSAHVHCHHLKEESIRSVEPWRRPDPKRARHSVRQGVLVQIWSEFL